MEARELVDSLPPHLAERCRWMESPRGPGDFMRSGMVVYWTHHALRTAENPALDTARWIAATRNVPLLVYQGLSERYHDASDRHHRFLLEGAADLQRQCRDLGLAYRFHLERPGHRQQVLVEMMRNASVLVTDDFPLAPTRSWVERLRRLTSLPILLVDASCVLPMTRVTKAYTRAFAYRDAFWKEYQRRIPMPWPSLDLPAAIHPENLPIEEIEVDSAKFSQWIAECEIDHSVGPVLETRGGSGAAEERWESFLRAGIDQYAARRNDCAVAGVSRMSPYLHYGMIAPMRMARDADARGAEKYLEELLIWRELAYAFCYHTEEVDDLSAIPEWARKTLMEHQRDARESIHAWESLARGGSGDRLWDLAQCSLLRHGELHNNLRMTWGKAMLQWTRTPEEALRMMVDLNHRYALDGRDPASYGGILWCLGQFDRPFEPPQPILGTVRPRPTDEHARRVDLKRLERHVKRPAGARRWRVAVVGAGLAGLHAARILSDHGHDVELFDKGRGPGGRVATRRIEEALQFDHGAQYFTIRDRRLVRLLQSWHQMGVVAPWEGKIVSIQTDGTVTPTEPMQRWVAVPRMSQLGRHLAEGLQLHAQTPISQVVAQDDMQSMLIDGKGDRHGPFDAVLLNLPPRQIGPLLKQPCQWLGMLEQTQLLPCLAAMVAFAEPFETGWDGAFVQEHPVRWVARDSSKVGRPKKLDCWVLHADANWSIDHLEEDPDQSARQLLRYWNDRLGGGVPEPIFVQGHRWRYSIPSPSLDCQSLWDPARGWGACGDWCASGRMEGALLSGMALAGRVLNHLHDPSLRPTPPPQQALLPLQ
ncbi:MAG: FAD-dependent oxidoreductase [Pirellulaceae bacterium]